MGNKKPLRECQHVAPVFSTQIKVSHKHRNFTSYFVFCFAFRRYVFFFSVLLLMLYIFLCVLFLSPESGVTSSNLNGTTCINTDIANLVVCFCSFCSGLAEGTGAQHLQHVYITCVFRHITMRPILSEHIMFDAMVWFCCGVHFFRKVRLMLEYQSYMLERVF